MSKIPPQRVQSGALGGELFGPIRCHYIPFINKPGPLGKASGPVNLYPRETKRITSPAPNPLEDRFSIREDRVQRIPEIWRAPREIETYLFDVLLPAFADLLAELELQRSGRKRLIATFAVIRDDVRNQGARDAVCTRLRILFPERGSRSRR